MQIAEKSVRSIDDLKSFIDDMPQLLRDFSGFIGAIPGLIHSLTGFVKAFPALVQSLPNLITLLPLLLPALPAILAEVPVLSRIFPEILKEIQDFGAAFVDPNLLLSVISLGTSLPGLITVLPGFIASLGVLQIPFYRTDVLPFNGSSIVSLAFIHYASEINKLF